MSTINPKCFLIDGPLMGVEERRAGVTAQMAKTLMEQAAYLEIGDTTRCLHAAGFNTVDIMMLGADARHHVLQEIVAREMSDE